MKQRAQPWNQKLSDKQCKEILHRYVDECETVEDLAKEYGVNKSSIYRALQRPAAAEAMKNLREAQLAAEQLRLSRLVPKAINRVEEILDTDFDDNHKYLHQQTAVDIMNRMGLKEQKNEKQDINITFAGGGFEVGMPENGDESE